MKSLFLAPIIILLLLSSNGSASYPWASQEWADTSALSDGDMYVKTAMSKTLSMQDEILSKKITTEVTAMGVEDIDWSTASFVRVVRPDGTIESKGYEVYQGITLLEPFDIKVVDNYNINVPIENIDMAAIEWKTSYILKKADKNIDIPDIPPIKIPGGFDFEQFKLPASFENLSQDMDMEFTIGITAPSSISKDGMTCSWTQTYTAEVGPIDMVEDLLETRK